MFSSGCFHIIVQSGCLTEIVFIQQLLMKLHLGFNISKEKFEGIYIFLQLGLNIELSMAENKIKLLELLYTATVYHNAMALTQKRSSCKQ